MVSWKLIQKASILEKREVLSKKMGAKLRYVSLSNTYHVGCPTGISDLYQILNAMRMWSVKELSRRPRRSPRISLIPTPLFSLESQKPLSSFDILAFSISFENDFLNVLTLLELAHIPSESHLVWKYRGWSQGGRRFLNPEPWVNSLISSSRWGRRGHRRIFRSLSSNPFKKGKRERDEFLRNLGRWRSLCSNVLSSDLYWNGKIGAMNLNQEFPERSSGDGFLNSIDSSSIHSFYADTEFKDGFSGSNRGCQEVRFCAACFVYHPFRNRSLPAWIGFKGSSFKGASDWLTGTAVSDHPQLLPCARASFHRKEKSLCPPEVDASPHPDSCLEKERKYRSDCPWAGSERLRRMWKKVIPKRRFWSPLIH